MESLLSLALPSSAFALREIQTKNSGAEELLEAGREAMISRTIGFLSQPAIRETLSLLGEPGTVIQLDESFSEVEEMKALRGMGTETWLVHTGISLSEAPLEASPLKLHVEPQYRAGMEEQLRGSRKIELVSDPEVADLMAGSEEYIRENRQRSPRALFLQVGDSSALAILTENFLLVIASQRDKLAPGSVLVIGLRIGADSAVLFQYL